MNTVLKLEGVEKTYQAGDVRVKAVRGVSLEVAAGEFVAIMGSSGSGKSTLMNILGCLDRPTAGSYQLDGVDVSGLDRDQLADIRNQKIGFVFQSFNLLARTSALENVQLPMLYRRPHLRSQECTKRALHALELVGLADRASHHPNQLSGGQQQRVAIARALVNQPALLLTDEPTGNLDSQTSVEVIAVLQRLNAAGVTVVMVTHELDIARFAMRNLVMRDGRVAADRVLAEPLLADAELERLQQARHGIELAA